MIATPSLVFSFTRWIHVWLRMKNLWITVKLVRYVILVMMLELIKVSSIKKRRNVLYESIFLFFKCIIF